MTFFPKLLSCTCSPQHDEQQEKKQYEWAWPAKKHPSINIMQDLVVKKSKKKLLISPQVLRILQGFYVQSMCHYGSKMSTSSSSYIIIIIFIIIILPATSSFPNPQATNILVLNITLLFSL